MQPARPITRAKTPSSLITIFPLSPVPPWRSPAACWFVVRLHGIMSAGYRQRARRRWAHNELTWSRGKAKGGEPVFLRWASCCSPCMQSGDADHPFPACASRPICLMCPRCVFNCSCRRVYTGRAQRIWLRATDRFYPIVVGLHSRAKKTAAVHSGILVRR